MHYPIIDAHQHFWKFDPKRDNWITDEMKVLQKDYLPADVSQIFIQNHIDGSVAVQASASEDENKFLLEIAAQFPYVKGVVGWIDFDSNELEEKLKYYQQYSLMKGFRHLLQGETDRSIMLNPTFQKGISVLNKFGFSYDLLILPDQLGFAEKLVAAFPDQRFVIDHLAKPPIKKDIISEWKSAIQQFAPHQNVYCKISGLVNEADWEFWETNDFRPYINIIMETFGTKRVMFGSDWPVCLLAGTYDEVKEIADDYFNSFSFDEKSDFFGRNAVAFYHLT
jgi:L-fuconolactonase